MGKVAHGGAGGTGLVSPRALGLYGHNQLSSARVDSHLLKAGGVLSILQYNLRLIEIHINLA